MSKEEGKIIDEYQFESKNILGKGSFGAVYKGVDTKRNRTVAVKVIPSTMFEGDKDLMTMLKREISNMMAISNETDYVVKLYDVKRSKTNLYMMLEYCEDGSLEDLLKRNNNRISEQETLKVISQVLDAFKVLHKHQIAHRDLKPQNILLHHGIAKVADFGFSKVYEGPNLMSSLLGSPLYAAPQILLGQKYSNKCDIWSLGVMMFEMIFATFPWMANTPPDLAKKIKSTALKIPTTPPTSQALKDLFAKMLVLDEAARISWEELFAHPLMRLAPDQTELAALEAEKDDLKKSIGFLKFHAQNNMQVYNAAEIRRINNASDPAKSPVSTEPSLEEHKDPSGKFEPSVAEQILKEESLKKEYRKYGNRIAYERTLLKFLTRYFVYDLYTYINQLSLKPELYYRLLFSSAKFYMTFITELKENLENKTNMYGFAMWTQFIATKDYQDFVLAFKQEYASFFDFYKACMIRAREFVAGNSASVEPRRLPVMQALVNDNFKKEATLLPFMKEAFADFFRVIKTMWATCSADRKLLLLIDLMLIVDKGLTTAFKLDENNFFDFYKYNEDREARDIAELRSDIQARLAPF